MTDSQSQKQDQGKAPVDLIDPTALVELARVLEFGATKYSPNGWRKGVEWSRTVAAMLRHIYAFQSGQTHDPETGLNHMAHVMCNAMFLVNFETTHPELDDRFDSESWQEKKYGMDEHYSIYSASSPNVCNVCSHISGSQADVDLHPNKRDEIKARAESLRSEPSCDGVSL